MFTLDIERRDEAVYDPVGRRKYRVDVPYAVLRQEGKTPTEIALTEIQLPWFNALRELLRTHTVAELKKG